MNPERLVWTVADGVATLFLCAATTARTGCSSTPRR